MNVKLACTTVYGVFAPYTAGGHGILDIQRNSSCDPCPSPPSSPLSSSPRIPARPESGGNELPKLEIGLAKLELSIKKWVRLIRFRVSATHFHRILVGRGFEVKMREETRVETDMDHSWNSAVYPEFRGLQPYKEQKLRKRLYMPISHSSFTVIRVL